MTDLSKVLTALGGNALLVGQVLFSTAFVGSCEVANLLGPRQVNTCIDRWYVITALFFPSATQIKGVAAADNRRRGIFGGSNAPHS